MYGWNFEWGSGSPPAPSWVFTPNEFTLGSVIGYTSEGPYGELTPDTIEGETVYALENILGTKSCRLTFVTDPALEWIQMIGPGYELNFLYDSGTRYEVLGANVADVWALWQTASDTPQDVVFTEGVLETDYAMFPDNINSSVCGFNNSNGGLFPHEYDGVSFYALEVNRINNRIKLTMTGANSIFGSSVDIKLGDLDWISIGEIADGQYQITNAGTAALVLALFDANIGKQVPSQFRSTP